MTVLHSRNERLRFSRRSILVGGSGVAGIATLSLAGCDSGGGDTAAGDESGGTEPDPNRPKEAPTLTEMVEAGDLPPLEDRLPVESDRLVVDVPEYGTYGGTYRGAAQGPGDNFWITANTSWEPMLRPSPDLSEMGLPGILKDVEMSEDGTEYTLHLREGLRWSDGSPCTAEDAMFAIEDVYLNTELYTSPPGIMTVDGETCTAEQLDDYTIALTFPSPKGDFIDLSSRQFAGGNFFYFPKHYMSQFLPDYNDDAVELADEAGYSDWTSYWDDRTEFFNNPDKPVLTAWQITDPLNSGTVCTLERNPYYWKVDPDGAQLPYIDRMQFEIIQDEEVMLLNAINGDLDYHARHFHSDRNRPVLADAQEEADFHFITVEPTQMNRVVISLNLNHPDEELREIFQNKDFRIGLSHAINRQEIIDTTLQRQGEPWQAAPHRESAYFDEEFAKQYTEYDLELASQYLDDAGLTDMDGSGYRLRPNGDRLIFNVDVEATSVPHWAPAMEMVVDSWAQVGVDARINSIERTLFYDRKTPTANEQDAAVWNGDGGLRIEMIEPRYWFPFSNESLYAPLWADWFASRGESEHGEEPPEETRRQMELYWEIQVEPDPDEQDRLFREILSIAKEQFYTIGIALPGLGYGIVKNDMHNVAEHYHDAWMYYPPAQVNPPTWFFDR